MPDSGHAIWGPSVCKHWSNWIFVSWRLILTLISCHTKKLIHERPKTRREVTKLSGFWKEFEEERHCENEGSFLHSDEIPACLAPLVDYTANNSQNDKTGRLRSQCPVWVDPRGQETPRVLLKWVISLSSCEGWQRVKFWRPKECLPSNVTPDLSLSLEDSFWEERHLLWWRNVCKVQEFLPILLQIHFLQLESSKIKSTKKNRHMAWSHFYESISIFPVCKNA